MMDCWNDARDRPFINVVVFPKSRTLLYFLHFSSHLTSTRNRTLTLATPSIMVYMVADFWSLPLTSIDHVDNVL